MSVGGPEAEPAPAEAPGAPAPGKAQTGRNSSLLPDGAAGGVRGYEQEPGGCTAKASEESSELAWHSAALAGGIHILWEFCRGTPTTHLRNTPRVV